MTPPSIPFLPASEQSGLGAGAATTPSQEPLKVTTPLAESFRIPFLGWTVALVWAAVFWTLLGVGCVRLHHAAKRIEINAVLREWGLTATAREGEPPLTYSLP